MNKFEVGDKVKHYSENAQMWFTGSFRGMQDSTMACVYWSTGVQNLVPIAELVKEDK